jgi:hypothetical protein
MAHGLCSANVETGSHITIAPTHELTKYKLITEKCLSMLIRESRITHI